jgi:hypothetical protein
MEDGPCNESPTPIGKEREREEKEEVNIDAIEQNIDRAKQKKELKRDTVRWTVATQNCHH